MLKINGFPQFSYVFMFIILLSSVIYIYYERRNGKWLLDFHAGILHTKNNCYQIWRLITVVDRIFPRVWEKD